MSADDATSQRQDEDPEAAHGDLTGQVTRILRQYADGEGQAFDDLMAVVYDELRRIARRQLGRMRFGETLNTTGLVHEAYLKMVDQRTARWQDRKHFFAICAHAMRQIIVDHARRRNAQKRGGGERGETLDEGLVADRQARTILELDEALEALRQVDERMVKVVECRFFAGMTEQETSDALDMSLRTVQRTWTRARAWLKREMRR
ncbi:MAG: sigma-70 family RNA polymerase sigma factor [Acidobacteriota bacterium]